MNKVEIRNATITKVFLGYEEHGIFTCYLTLDYGGSFQAFGGYSFDTPVKVDGTFSHREGSKYGMDFIIGIIKTLGLKNWEDLKGTNVRVKCEYTKVRAIGHLLNDDWFCPSELTCSS